MLVIRGGNRNRDIHPVRPGRKARVAVDRQMELVVLNLKVRAIPPVYGHVRVVHAERSGVSAADNAVQGLILVCNSAHHIKVMYRSA